MLAAVDDLLRSEGRFAPDRSSVPWLALLVALTCFGFANGAVMGSFGGRWLQALYSGVKVPMLLLAATAVCLPNFFVVNTLLGLREDFAAAFRAILAAQATVAACLASLAPATALVYLSTDNYRFALVSNGAVFALATLGGQKTLSRHYAPLLARDPRHLRALTAWLVLYVFVAIQLAWMLRPFVGYPGMRTEFFREEKWDNAYVILIRVIWELLTHR